ncbi:MAG: exo-alpha-sialidase [Verrucomicrobiales bacterium]|nr:exo-alpha-sialidase [Verrucomicrobiales bacterium]
METQATTGLGEVTRRGFLGLALGWAASGCAGGKGRRSTTPVSPGNAELKREFIYEEASFPECHASTVVETREGLMASWFGGTGEGKDDVCIYTARRDSTGWSKPALVAEGVVAGDPRRYPCWNPVLFQGRDGPLWLFYKVGPRPNSWWGMVTHSSDLGRTWAPARRLPEGILGPIRAKPVQLRDGTVLCGSSTEHAGWQVQMEFTRDPLGSWERTAPLNRADEWGAIQPTLLLHGAKEIQILCRSRQGSILESWSQDSGRTWTPLARTPLPNPSAGIDAVALRRGGFLLVYNHTTRGRGLLNLAHSKDGRVWEAALVLENEAGEFSYPAMIQTRDGFVHLTYTWNRRKLRHVIVDPARLATRPMVDGQWPA